MANDWINTIPRYIWKNNITRTAHLSEKDWEVLGTIRLPYSFPSTTFRSFDHQWKTNFFCCLGAKDKETSLEVRQFPRYQDNEKVLARWPPGSVYLQAFLYIFHTTLVVNIFWDIDSFPLLQTIFRPLHRQTWRVTEKAESSQGWQTHTQPRSHRASPHHTALDLAPGPTEHTHGPSASHVAFYFLKE